MPHFFGMIVCVGVLVMLTVCGSRDRIIDQTIRRDATLTSEWTEITPEKPLKTERQQQEIVLYLAEPFSGDFEAKGVRLADGSIVHPEVQLVDTSGRTYDLKYYGFRGHELIRFTLKDQLKGKEFRTVRIRSEKPIHCKEIIWSYFNWGDVI